ncbi:catalase A [Ciborinia camelliae]|nr:catalase A [Ciborinia camelliae]
MASPHCRVEEPRSLMLYFLFALSISAHASKYYAPESEDLLPQGFLTAPPRSRPPKGEDYYTLPNGAGAYGEFEVTHDITNVTSLAFLNQIGKKTPLFARFSTVAGEKGSADNVRDARGFAFKMYTEEGNLDWLMFSAPVFQIRDPAKFASVVHAQKRDPRTNLKDPTMFWDYFNHNSEAYNFLVRLFGGQGIPTAYQYADIFGINLYKFTKPDGTFKYVKLHLKTNQGTRNQTLEEAVKTSGHDPDYSTRELYQTIERGNFPSWTVYAQIIDPLEAESYHINVFDATRLIPEEDYPLIPFGKITLNRNPVNFFMEVEQAAFSVANIVPGWDISPDPSELAFICGFYSRAFPLTMD